MSEAKQKRTPRETLQFVLDSEMPIECCEYLHLSKGTTFQTALIMGGIERALRGDSQAWAAIMEYADPITFGEDEMIDELSASIYEELAKHLDERAGCQETSDNEQD